MQLNTIAGQNIRQDSQSGDKALPWFMYIIEGILAFNYIVVPLAGMLGKTKMTPMELPTNLLGLFGVCITDTCLTEPARVFPPYPETLRSACSAA